MLKQLRQRTFKILCNMQIRSGRVSSLSELEALRRSSPPFLPLVLKSRGHLPGLTSSDSCLCSVLDLSCSNLNVCGNNSKQGCGLSNKQLARCSSAVTARGRKARTTACVIGKAYKRSEREREELKQKAWKGNESNE